MQQQQPLSGHYSNAWPVAAPPAPVLSQQHYALTVVASPRASQEQQQQQQAPGTLPAGLLPVVASPMSPSHQAAGTQYVLNAGSGVPAGGVMSGAGSSPGPMAYTAAGGAPLATSASQHGGSGGSVMYVVPPGATGPGSPGTVASAGGSPSASPYPTSSYPQSQGQQYVAYFSSGSPGPPAAEGPAAPASGSPPPQQSTSYSTAQGPMGFGSLLQVSGSPHHSHSQGGGRGGAASAPMYAALSPATPAPVTYATW
jgi:hypothetical protein